MIADYMDSLVAYGASFYRNLFWEAGLVGQVLYLEAEEAGIRSTGIGCYFDDPVHEVFGISSRDWQSFYHFTVCYYSFGFFELLKKMERETGVEPATSSLGI